MSTEPPPAAPGVSEHVVGLARAMMRATPHSAALGFELVDVAPAKAWAKVAYREDLIGDPETGIIAGGVVTALLDQLCGAAVLAALESPMPMATLDLRIDYLRPAEPGAAIIGMAHCYKRARSVAFVRAIAYEHSEDDPIAHATAVFMLNTTTRARREARS